VSPVSVFHVSDLHFGRPAVPAQIDAIEGLIQERRFDVVAISGDLTQRARSGEFQRAHAFIRDASRVSRTIVVPGNHDVKWWWAPLGIGNGAKITENYREYIDPNLEPALRVDGATFVGINTAQGVTRRTLTWNMRDISIIGDVRKSQIERARLEFAESPDSAARVIVMHHNPVRGELSQRHGLKNTKRILGAFAEIGVDLVLCGHDHQEAIHYVEHTKKGTVISTAGTVSNRSRGGRPSSVNVITLSPSTIEVSTSVWSDAMRNFVPGASQCFAR
jgi:3',5'-cyclic AMP phosphodiesterase CpdA